MAVIYHRYLNNCIIFKAARSLSSVSKDINIAGSNKTKPFKEIPGPVRLPIIGNLYQYKFGMFYSCVRIFFVSLETRKRNILDPKFNFGRGINRNVIP
jgi:hypothetical protein